MYQVFPNLLTDSLVGVTTPRPERRGFTAHRIKMLGVRAAFHFGRASRYAQ